MNNSIYMCVKPRKFETVHCEIGEPDSDYLLVEYLFCGICGGDYSVYLGRRNQYPVTLGHEFVARVLEVGQNVLSFSMGDLVISDFNFRCGTCQFCITGKSHLCIKNGIGLFSNRGFSKYGLLHQNYLYKVPQVSNLTRLTMIEPLSCVIHAIREFSINPKDTILICGGGSIGSMFVFYLSKILKHAPIYMYEKNKKRLENLQQLFPVIDAARNPHKTFDKIIDCTNQMDGTALALELATPGSSICIMSHLYGLDTSFIYETICKKELHPCFPLRNGHVENVHTAIEYIVNNWKDEYDNLIGVYDEVNAAFQQKEVSAYNKQVIKMYA